MRIGFDIRKYHDYGIGTYIQNLVSAFQNIPDYEMIYFVSADVKETLPKLLNGQFIIDNSAKYSVAELLKLSQKANRQKLSLYHSPHYTLPVNLRVPSVVTIHDIIHIRMKEYFSPAHRAYAYFVIRHACHASSAIIVDSEFGKTELIEMFKVDEKKIHVIHLGVNDRYFEKIEESLKVQFLRKYSIKQPYILYTGSLKPHKNISILLEAFNKICSQYDLRIVITGESIKDYPELQKKIESNKLHSSVIATGKLHEDDLRIAYQAAEMVILPSLYEGFGFSMVEAMASQVPAIGARSSSITEVVADAGLLFDPFDVDSLVAQIKVILDSREEKEKLIRKGNERAKMFTWEKCVNKTIDVYQKIGQ